MPNSNIFKQNPQPRISSAPFECGEPGDKSASELHVHSNKKAVLNRLARLIGHLDSVKRMVERDVDCSEVLVQLAAVKSALNNTGKVILQDHISECIVTAAVHQDYDKIDDLNRAIAQFIK